MKISFLYWPIPLAFMFLACSRIGGSPSVGKKKSDSSTVVSSPTSSGRDDGAKEDDFEPLPEAEWPRALLNKVNEKLYGHLLCENGPIAVDNAGKTNLENIFKVACNGKSPTKTMAQLFSGAYDGSGEPVVKTVKYSVNDNFVTHFTYGFAIKSRLKSPAGFSGLPIYDELGKGLISRDSIVFTKKIGEKAFPGKGSVREINLVYDLPFGEAAGLYDHRETQMNTYLLVEGTQDINITVEHLLNPEMNNFYHISNGIIIGVKGEPGETYLVYIIELILKNRFDPGRVQRTIIELAKKIQETVYRVSLSAN